MGGNGSGRPSVELDFDMMVDMLQDGHTMQSIAGALGVSKPTISTRIAKLQEEEGVLLQYRAIRTLHLTKLQADILERVTPEKIDAASLVDLVRAYKILSDKEDELDGTSGKVKGLLAHLVELEKRNFALQTKLPEAKVLDEDAVDADFSDIIDLPKESR